MTEFERILEDFHAKYDAYATQLYYDRDVKPDKERAYIAEHVVGRKKAAKAIAEAVASEDMGRFVRRIRSAVADQSGVGTGFLYAMAERVTAVDHLYEELRSSHAGNPYDLTDILT